MSAVNWIIVYFIIFVICCVLLGYMGRKRTIGSRRAGFIPFVIGIVSASILLWLYNEGTFQAGTWFGDLRNVFLLPFLVSLGLGYLLVKLSPALPGFMQELEKIYEHAIRYETRGETQKAIAQYREAMQRIIHERSRLKQEEARKYDNLVNKLETKISSLQAPGENKED